MRHSRRYNLGAPHVFTHYFYHVMDQVIAFCGAVTYGNFSPKYGKPF